MADPILTRRAWLATAVQAEPTPVTTQRAAQLYATSPWSTAGRNTARKDLRALAGRGVLVAIDGPRRTYTTNPDRSAA
ncbi:hypothetical protein [Streptomyces sp. NPDC056227]|uniref:hypothetical protein n=1 Tax=Streptomyces sp. NPDC056227 TaxID=3345753 RepID=UPI0035E14D3C